MKQLTTLCYLQQDGKYLMLHRVVKKQDVNKDKWIGVGGHFEEGESPEECLLREVREETGYELCDYTLRGIVTFVLEGSETEYMWLYTADQFTGTPIACDEGVLQWVSIEEVWDLNLWEGDKIFFRLLDEGRPFFSLKLEYRADGVLQRATLDGTELELFDLVDEHGEKIGVRAERGVVHRRGLRHKTVHTWIVRRQEQPGGCGYDVLLQKRSEEKDSNPGCYDISSAGHIEAGSEALPAAIRELREELGITAEESELTYVGSHAGAFEAYFHGKLFRDQELSTVFLYQKPVKDEMLHLQESEIASVLWMDYLECEQAIRRGSIPNCIYADEFQMVGEYLGLADKKSSPV